MDGLETYSRPPLPVSGPDPTIVCFGFEKTPQLGDSGPLWNERLGACRCKESREWGLDDGSGDPVYY
eukprot:1392860-Amorphochlora_amoeboformis.AAC.1